MFPSES